MTGFQRSGQMDRGCGCGVRVFDSELLAGKALIKGASLPGAGAVPKVAPCPRRPGAWHLVTPPDEAGFSRPVKLLVRARAGNGDAAGALCEACGTWLGRRLGQVHHLIGRGMGGCWDEVINGCANAALLCGTPATGCHGLATRFDREIGARGFWLPRGADPRLVPMMLASPHGSGASVWRSEDGRYLTEAPAGAAA